LEDGLELSRILVREVTNGRGVCQELSKALEEIKNINNRSGQLEYHDRYLIDEIIDNALKTD
jgi:hypothetical protein